MFGGVLAWGAVLIGLAFWSVGHERPSVPEQRTVEQALPELQKATGVLLAAAAGPGRAVELGNLSLVRGCRVTPVRDGAVARRDVAVQVPVGEARRVLEAVAAGLPAAYRAEASGYRGGARIELHADAGNFIGIDADVASAATAVTLRVSSGCRPAGPGAPPADPAVGEPPAVFGAVLRALGAPVVRPAVVPAVRCPDGQVVGTFVAEVARPADLAARLLFLGEPVQDEGDVQAYRVKASSVVVVTAGSRLRISVTSSC